MKHLFTLLLSLFVFGAATAQVDAKINAGSAITWGVNVAAEFPFGQQTAFSVGAAYSSLGLLANEVDDYRYRNLRLIPEFRYYFNPRAGFDRFYVGGYGKLGQLTGTNRDTDESVDAARAALGILTGHKWVTGGGFVFELNLGVGRAATFGGNDNDAQYAAAIGALTAIDLRMGIIVGWRIGGGRHD
ncbi:uncharacterized protein DUF3575 [Neolewinella xylanilytica]|uniref:Uncharacterized protein DUF3575 n=1 Tax=Neolewinella xylanilytica TaxID=1514080 RepID=A0A2S6IAX8_9BACT|nr:DUF3575 domain-containing protein [Neolewinella xylanilytica]PPK88663.1 uncharacterized protein DUF3575 [Neolewinella xylanilytica]